MRTNESPGVALARLRWANATEADREQVRKNGRLGGRPRSKAARCPCGEMTLKRAQARGHRCSEPL
jgi:hypothetical protein